MASNQKIFVGADHAGFQLKNKLVESLKAEFPNSSIEDLGCHSEQSVDYPNFAKAVAEKVVASNGLGILVCGSGIGMAISANKIHGARAASSWDATSARLCRQHNDANIVCIGSRLTGPEVALELTKVFLNTEFEDGRHSRRVDMIRKLETP